jgi:hypothetical protein
MITHIVMWKLKENAEGGSKIENMVKLRNILEALPAVIDGILKFEIGINFNPDGYDIVLYSVFERLDTLDAYQIHPEHLKVRAFVKNVTEGRSIVDYEI